MDGGVQLGPSQEFEVCNVISALKSWYEVKTTKLLVKTDEVTSCW